MPSQIINISLPKDLVEKIDKAAKNQYANRSEYIRQAIVGRLKAQDSDIWEDLAAGTDELRDKAQQAGYVDDKDFAKAVKEVRRATIGK
jgi:Arc/MetJ-type ribon-helix-helix transcriptional regulator